MVDSGIFSILFFALTPVIFIAIVQVVKQSLQQKKLIECRKKLIAKKESMPSQTEKFFFPEHICMIENMSKLKQHNKGQSPYSVWWSSFKIRDFSANCKMVTTERGLR